MAMPSSRPTISAVSRTRPSGLRQNSVGPGARVELGLEGAADGGGLAAAEIGEGGVLGALHAALGVPRGLAVAQQVDGRG